MKASLVRAAKQRIKLASTFSSANSTKSSKPKVSTPDGENSIPPPKGMGIDGRASAARKKLKHKRGKM